MMKLNMPLPHEVNRPPSEEIIQMEYEGVQAWLALGGGE